MIIEIDLDFLIKHNMTVEQYFVCYVLEEDRRAIKNGQREERKNGQPIAAIYKYSENVGGLKRKAMEDLIDREYVILTGDRLAPDMLEVTDKFKKEVFNHWINFYQLFDVYPNRVRFNPGGPLISLKTLDKPKEELGKYYEDVVRTNKKHREILEITEWAKETDRIRVGIQKYVYSQHWEQLRDDYETKSDEDDNYEILI